MESQDHMFVCTETKAVNMQHKAWIHCCEKICVKGFTGLHILTTIDTTTCPMIAPPPKQIPFIVTPAHIDIQECISQANEDKKPIG